MVYKDDMLIKYGSDKGDKIFDKILNDYPELDNDDVRQAAVLFSLLTNCIQYLHLRGWTEKDLVNEVFTHCEIVRSFMEDDEDDEE